MIQFNFVPQSLKRTQIRKLMTGHRMLQIRYVTPILYLGRLKIRINAQTLDRLDPEDEGNSLIKDVDTCLPTTHLNIM
jgi:hypothetical protein